MYLYANKSNINAFHSGSMTTVDDNGYMGSGTGLISNLPNNTESPILWVSWHGSFWYDCQPVFVFNYILDGVTKSVSVDTYKSGSNYMLYFYINGTKKSTYYHKIYIDYKMDVKIDRQNNVVEFYVDNTLQYSIDLELTQSEAISVKFTPNARSLVKDLVVADFCTLNMNVIENGVTVSSGGWTKGDDDSYTLDEGKEGIPLNINAPQDSFVWFTAEYNTDEHKLLVNDTECLAGFNTIQLTEGGSVEIKAIRGE